MDFPKTYYRLNSIEDALGNETQFSYSENAASYTCDADYTAINNYTLLLTSVTHPTGAVTQYAYTDKHEKLGEDGYFTAYKVTSRKDQINNTDYNSYTFSYNGLYSSETTYYTTVYKPSDLIIRYTFNEDHLNTLEERFSGSISTSNRKETITKSYNSNKLLTSSRTRIYTNSSTYREIYESYAYNDFGDLTKYTDAYSHVTTFSYYTTNQNSQTYCYSIPTGKSYKQDANTVIRESYVLFLLTSVL